MPYKNNPTNLITETFTELDIPFTVDTSDGGIELIRTVIPITCGPNIIVTYICEAENDVAVRVFDIVNSVPFEKKDAITKACNLANKNYRFIKCYPKEDEGGVNLEFDMLASTPSEFVGAMALEIFVKFKHIIDLIYPELIKALYME